MGRRRKKLITVARLFYSDPAKYGRSCSDCRKWVYESDTGRRALDKTKRLPDGTQDPTGFLLRHPSQDTPCHDCGKTAGMATQLRHWRYNPPDPPGWCYKAFTHYRQCKATNWNTPDSRDPIVRRNAALFREVEESHERTNELGLLAVLGLLKRK